MKIVSYITFSSSYYLYLFIALKVPVRRCKPTYTEFFMAMAFLASARSKNNKTQVNNVYRKIVSNDDPAWEVYMMCKLCKI